MQDMSAVLILIVTSILVLLKVKGRKVGLVAGSSLNSI